MSFFFKKVLFYSYECVRRCACAQVPGLWSPEELVRGPGTGVISGCEVPGMGAGKQSLVLYESSKHS